MATNLDAMLEAWDAAPDPGAAVWWAHNPIAAAFIGVPGAAGIVSGLDAVLATAPDGDPLLERIAGAEFVDGLYARALRSPRPPESRLWATLLVRILKSGRARAPLLAPPQPPGGEGADPRLTGAEKMDAHTTVLAPDALAAAFAYPWLAEQLRPHAHEALRFARTPAMVDALVELGGADVRQPMPPERGGGTPLHGCHPRVVPHLLALGVDPSVVDAGGRTAVGAWVAVHCDALTTTTTTSHDDCAAVFSTLLAATPEVTQADVDVVAGSLRFTLSCTQGRPMWFGPALLRAAPHRVRMLRRLATKRAWIQRRHALVGTAVGTATVLAVAGARG